MKGLSRACEFYAKLFLHGVNEFLEGSELCRQRLNRPLTFAEKRAEEKFHPQLEALLITCITAKLPDPVKTRAYNRRSQLSHFQAHYRFSRDQSCHFIAKRIFVGKPA